MSLVANQNVWLTTKNESKMSLIAENKEEAQSQGIIKISVHYSIVVDTRPLFFSKKKINGTCLDKELFHFQFGLHHNSNVD